MQMSSAPDGPRAEWLGLLPGLTVDEETLFPRTSGFFARRANARRARWLQAIRPVLDVALQPGERIRFVARGVRYNGIEFYVSGYSALYGNQIALVLTDRRVLFLDVNGKGKPRDIKNQVRLDEVRCGKSRLGTSFDLFLADGHRLRFIRLGKDRKVLQQLLPQLPKAEKAEARSLEYLCPNCLKVIPGRPEGDRSCPNELCRIPLRSPRKAARLSLMLPGLGDLYLRHHFFGTLELLVSSFSLIIASVFTLAVAFQGSADDWGAAALLIGLFVIIPRIADYFITLHMGRKGYVPLALRAGDTDSFQSLPMFPRWAVIGVPAVVILTCLAIVGAIPLLLEQAMHGSGATSSSESGPSP